MEPDPRHVFESIAFSLSQLTASTQEEADAAAAARNPEWKAHHDKLKANPLSAEQAQIYGMLGGRNLSATETRNMLQQAVARNRPIDLNFLGNCGGSPLHKACYSNDVEKVKVLLRFGKATMAPEGFILKTGSAPKI
jgi:hypothetical protein